MTINSESPDNNPRSVDDSEEHTNSAPTREDMTQSDELYVSSTPDTTSEDKPSDSAEDSDSVEIDLIEAIEEDRDESTFAKKTKLQSVSNFDELKLTSEVAIAIGQLGWLKPTPVQGLCLPYTLAGRDVAGFAQTGTGKTGVFLITVADALLRRRVASEEKSKSPLAVVLAPTRELAVQIHEEVEKLAEKLSIKSLAVFGGMDYDKQAQSLRHGVDIVVATPGRLKDYIQKKVVSIKETSLFVCDEVDRMFDMGFIEDVEFFLEFLPEKCQKLLFSATTNEKVKELAFEYLDNPEYISVNPEEITPESIEQHLILCDTPEKLRVLMGLLREHQPSRAVIFTNTKLTAEWLKHKLRGNQFEVDSITGDMAQTKRISLIRRIKAGQIKLLIGTDVASRGLHISDVTHVYNFDLPGEPANYVHRIGRTARAGAKGQSFSLVCEEYAENLDGIKKYVGESLPPCRWFDEKYLEIIDISGNPFHDGKVRGFNISDRKTQSRSPRGPRDTKGRGAFSPRMNDSNQPVKYTDRPKQAPNTHYQKQQEPNSSANNSNSNRSGESTQGRQSRGRNFNDRHQNRGRDTRNYQNNQPHNQANYQGHRLESTQDQMAHKNASGNRVHSKHHRNDRQDRKNDPITKNHSSAAPASPTSNQGFLSVLGKVFKSLFGVK